MIIHGLQKLTLVDYPGYVAAILFTGACNFRCPFCQNGSLVLAPDKEPVIQDDEIFSYLDSRRGKLEAVVITGGEPTLQSDLIPFMKRIKELGYRIKLDTNGYRPEVLKNSVESGYVDYVAMDIKNSLDHYAETAGLSFFNAENIMESVDYLMSDIVDYEFRTTVVEEYHRKENFEKIGKWLKGAKRYYLQSFVASEDIIGENLSSPSIEKIKTYEKTLKNYIKTVSIRDR